MAARLLRLGIAPRRRPLDAEASWPRLSHAHHQRPLRHVAPGFRLCLTAAALIGRMGVRPLGALPGPGCLLTCSGAASRTPARRTGLWRHTTHAPAAQLHHARRRPAHLLIPHQVSPTCIVGLECGTSTTRVGRGAAASRLNVPSVFTPHGRRRTRGRCWRGSWSPRSGASRAAAGRRRRRREGCPGPRGWRSGRSGRC
jgi:hypothetical protein